MNKILIKIKNSFSTPFAMNILTCTLPLPCFFLLLSFYLNLGELNLLEERLQLTAQKTFQIQKEKEVQNQMVKKILKADRFFIDKHVESLHFLQSETESLRSLSSASLAAKKRLCFLEGENRLVFNEENIRPSEEMQEVEEAQMRPIEIDEEDLKKILSIVEALPIGPYAPLENAPQFIVKRFVLTKKMKSSEENAFLLNMQLIKREPLGKL